MVMKKVLSLILVFSFIFAFCSACRKSGDDERLSFTYTLEDETTKKPKKEKSAKKSTEEVTEKKTENAEESTSEKEDDDAEESTKFTQPTSSEEAENDSVKETAEEAQSESQNESQEDSNEETQEESKEETPNAAPSSGAYTGPVNNGKVTYEDGLYYITDDSTGVKFIIANKTYALPESYNPGGLTGECSSAFNRLTSAAANDGYNIWNRSGFRSYSYQTTLYNNYVARDGKAAADTYSARPGHSEHQTGLAIDCNELSTSWGQTPEGKWLAAHCTEYGFIIRYGADKISSTGYQYEPWHIRYIGSPELAKKITDSGLSVEEYYGISSSYS